VVGEPPGQLASVVRCSTTKQSQAKRQHSKDQLVAVSHMSRDECVSVLQETKNIIPISFLNNISLEISLEFDTSKLYFDADHLSFEDFQRHWKMGLPMVITNLGKRSQIRWTPEYFINGQAGQMCRCVNSNVQGEELLMKVDEFFAGFDDHSLRKISPDGTPVCLKLKDWPSDADFKDKFPDLFEDFFRSIPFPEYTTREGTLNLASRMPMDFVRPDLGPKMYNAYGSSDKAYGRGTTNLHLDMTDAVNLMMYATPLEQRPEHELREREDRPSTNLREDSPAAVWDLYLPADLPKLREFLRGIATEQNVRVDDPIHDQCFFVDNRYRERLKQEYGISGIRLYQNPGDAVFIPAGCAHQVCNYTSCVKTAVDFVSPEGVERKSDEGMTTADLTVHLSNELKCLYEESFNTDVTIQVGEEGHSKIFHAH
ncbi:4348_t:CDS:2, partial [Paraglomus occultum]